MKLSTPCFFLAWSIASLAAACGGTVDGGSSSGDPTGSGGSGTGAGGTGSTSSTGSGSSAACTDTSQCTLHSDCCHCIALGPGETAPSCDIPECFMDACSGMGGITPGDPAICSGGLCIIGFDCNGSDVLCDSPPPSCPPGQVPTAGDCWGQCVDAVECRQVTSCADCDAATQVCVSYEGWGVEIRCIEVPPACAADRSCACLGEIACTQGFNACGDSPAPNEISCSCPAC